MPSASLGHLATNYGQEGLPALIPDTCALLDIIRLPIRSDPVRMRRELAAVQQIVVAASSSAPELRVYIAPQVLREWAENLPGVLKQANDTTAQWVSQGARFAEAQVHFSLAVVDIQSHGSLGSLFAALEALALAILSVAIVIDEDDAALIRAMRRVSMAVAPARKGGQASDCMIVEHALSVSAILTTHPTAPRAVFLSSNTSDYCDAGSSSLRPPLDADFAASRLAFATTWHWAASLLKPAISSGP